MHPLRDVLMTQWNARFGDIVQESRSKDVSNMTPEEAYRAGVRNGYWDAVVDLVNSGLVKLSSSGTTPRRDDALLDNVH